MSNCAVYNDHIILVTTTYYESIDEMRFHLAVETMRRCRYYGYRLVIIDGSPDESVATTLREEGALVFKQNHVGMGASRRQAFFEASEIMKSLRSNKEKVIVWLEPEKIDLIRQIPQIVRPILLREADVVIPSRLPISLNSYPTFQIESEQKGNKLFADTAGVELDVYFGPVAASLEASYLIIMFDPYEAGVVDTYIPQYLAAMALKSGLKVASVGVDFIFPAEQRRAEEGPQRRAMELRRNDQLQSVSQALNTLLERKTRYSSTLLLQALCLALPAAYFYMKSRKLNS